MGNPNQKSSIVSLAVCSANYTSRGLTNGSEQTNTPTWDPHGKYTHPHWINRADTHTKLDPQGENTYKHWVHMADIHITLDPQGKNYTNTGAYGRHTPIILDLQGRYTHILDPQSRHRHQNLIHTAHITST